MRILRMIRLLSVLAIGASMARAPLVTPLAAEAEGEEEGRFCNDDPGSYCARPTAFYEDKYCNAGGEYACETCCYLHGTSCSGLGSGGNHPNYDEEWNKCGNG